MSKKKRKFKKFKCFLFILVLGGLIYLYGTYIEPKNVQVHEYRILNSNIPSNFNGFKIVHISDIHYGRNFGLYDLKNLVKKLNELEPDILVMTGDLIDNSYKMTTTQTSDISDALNSIKTSSGKYIIEGDEDLSFDEWENIVQNSNFINLNNSFDTIYNKGYDFILIGGVNSFLDKESIINKNQKTENYLNSFRKDGPMFKILLMHEPDYITDFEKNPYDLVLAGHNTSGIVDLPFYGPILNAPGAQKYRKGHYKIKNTDLYISNGIGLRKINFRLFNTPSINVYRLIKTDS